MDKASGKSFLLSKSSGTDYFSLDYEFGHYIGSGAIFEYALDNLLSYKGNEESKNSNPLENIKYTPKVENQMKKGDYHSFPKSVEAFGKDGKVTKIIGGDKVERTKVEIRKGYLNLLLNPTELQTTDYLKFQNRRNYEV